MTTSKLQEKIYSANMQISRVSTTSQPCLDVGFDFNETPNTKSTNAKEKKNIKRGHLFVTFFSWNMK